MQDGVSGMACNGWRLHDRKVFKHRMRAVVHSDLEPQILSQKFKKVIQVRRARGRLLRLLHVVRDAREHVQLRHRRTVEAAAVASGRGAKKGVSLEMILRVPVQRSGSAAKVEDRRANARTQPAFIQRTVEYAAYERPHRVPEGRRAIVENKPIPATSRLDSGQMRRPRTQRQLRG